MQGRFFSQIARRRLRSEVRTAFETSFKFSWMLGVLQWIMYNLDGHAAG